MPPSDVSNHVIVRDGRGGRDPSAVTESGGEILHEFDIEHVYKLGERLTLPDGTEVEVIGERVATGRLKLIRGVLEPVGHMEQTLHVGNVWSSP